MARIEDYRTFNCTFGDNYSYPLSFAASVFLVEQVEEEDSYVNYWKLLGERPTWQQAFEEAFGIGVNDFYEDFDEWLPSQLLPAGCPAQAANALAGCGEPAPDLEIPLSPSRIPGYRLGEIPPIYNYGMERVERSALVHDCYIR